MEIYTRFQTRPLRNYVIIANEKDFFLPYSFGIETICSYIPVFPSKPIPGFQTKMGKVYTRFQTKNGAKALPLGGGGIYLYGFYKGVPPPGAEHVLSAACGFVWLLIMTRVTFRIFNSNYSTLR